MLSEWYVSALEHVAEDVAWDLENLLVEPEEVHDGEDVAGLDPEWCHDRQKLRPTVNQYAALIGEVKNVKPDQRSHTEDTFV